MSEVLSDAEKLRRKLLFIPCETKEHMAAWIKEYLGIQLPDCTVSEESNSNPLQNIWEAYDRLRRNDIVGFSRVMAYASRGGFKTLGASILEVMVVLHLGRNVAHMAASLEQSSASQEYVKAFFNIPIVQEFVTGQAEKQIRVVRYRHTSTNYCLTRKEYGRLSIVDRKNYKMHENYIKIVACTMRGANSKHVEFFVVDEVDVVEKQDIKAYQQAKNIPDPRDGMLPMTLLVSTRKSRTGLVQREIDEATKSGLQLRHWNIIDITESCKPARHKPDEPKQMYYVNDGDVKHITKDEFDVMNPAEQKKYYPVEGFAGCRSCRIFSACKGRLATHQKSTSPMLKPIEDAITKFQSAPTPDFILTEHLCRKPDTSGLVYPRFNPEKHMLTPEAMAELITGDPMPYIKDKAMLLSLMKQKGVDFYVGMDFGFSHNFAVIVIAVWGQYVFVVDVFAQAGLELDDKIQACEYIKTVYNNALIYPDPAYPADITTFRRKGFKVREWDKNKGSVKAGIEIVRTLLWSGKNTIRMFLLRDDPGCELLAKNMGKYKFNLDAAGMVTDEPDKSDDDECDALRYVVMNVAGSRGAIKTNDGPSIIVDMEAIKPALQVVQQPGQQQQWMQDMIRAAVGGGEGVPSSSSDVKVPPAQVKKGRFFSDL